jgi:hypothetical protein
MEIAYQGDARGEIIDDADPSYGEHGGIRSLLRHLSLSPLCSRPKPEWMDEIYEWTQFMDG